MDFGQLCEYPFNAQVWGTASDVAMVFVTGLTAWFLIKTFREQQKISQIESFRHAEHIKPYFELFSHRSLETVDGNILSRYYIFEMVTRNNTAKDILVEFISNDVKTLKEITEAWTFEILHGNERELIYPNHLKSFFQRRDKKLENYYFHATFIISFADIDGVEYKQKISFFDNDKDVNRIDAGPVIRADKSIHGNYFLYQINRFGRQYF